MRIHTKFALGKFLEKLPTKFHFEAIGKSEGCKISLLSIFQYAFILFIILDFRSFWLHTPEFTFTAKIIKVLMGLSVVGGVLCQGKKPALQLRKCLLALLFTTIYLAVYYFTITPLNNSIITYTIQLAVILVFCFLVETSFEDSMRKFCDIVLVIAIVSLCFWLFASLLHILQSTGKITTTWLPKVNGEYQEVNVYYNIYFEMQRDNLFGLLPFRFWRNTALFTEGPMVSMVFSLAFLAELFLAPLVNIKRRCILGLAVLSTISTTGWMVVIMGSLAKYLLLPTNNFNRQLIKKIILPLVLIGSIFALNYLLRQKLGTGSGSTRVDDFLAGFKAWLDAPLFGNGWGNMEAIKQYMARVAWKAEDYMPGFSNSPTQIFAFGGVYLAAAYLLPAVTCLITLIRSKAWQKLAFFTIYLFAFTVTVCPTQMLTFYLFIAMARQGLKLRSEASAVRPKMLNV